MVLDGGCENIEDLHMQRLSWYWEPKMNKFLFHIYPPPMLYLYPL